MVDPHSRLIRDLIAHSDGTASVIAASCRPWASATFTGTQHHLRLSAPPMAAEWLAEQLPEMAFAIPGHVVADIALTGCRLRGHAIELGIEALTIEER